MWCFKQLGITDRDELIQNYEEASSGHSFLFSNFLLKEKRNLLLPFCILKKSSFLIHLESRELGKVADMYVTVFAGFFSHSCFFFSLSLFLSWCVVLIYTGSQRILRHRILGKGFFNIWGQHPHFKVEEAELTPLFHWWLSCISALVWCWVRWLAPRRYYKPYSEREKYEKQLNLAKYKLKMNIVWSAC